MRVHHCTCAPLTGRVREQKHRDRPVGAVNNANVRMNAEIGCLPSIRARIYKKIAYAIRTQSRPVENDVTRTRGSFTCGNDRVRPAARYMLHPVRFQICEQIARTSYNHRVQRLYMYIYIA